MGARIPFLSEILLFALLTLLLSLKLTCNESLPPYSAPGSVFKGSIYPRPVTLKGEPQLRVLMTAQNIFDETLQDTAKLTGSLEIILASDQSLRKTVTLDTTNLLYHYNMILGYPTFSNIPSLNEHGVLTIDPKDSVSFCYLWNFVTDDNTNLLSLFHLTPDPRDPFHMLGARTTFIVRGSIQIFTGFGLVAFQPINYILSYGS
jgi:hypothetical protein